MALELIVIGTSLGGLRALETLLTALPPEFALPLAIVQHRHRSSDGEMLNFLQQGCPLPLVEPQDKQVILPGHVYIAPADYHLLVEPGYFSLSTDAPVCHARPSIDVLFETAADAYGRQCLGVILTGASEDGARGLACIQASGGMALVQLPSTAESAVMPKAAIARVPGAKVLPLTEIPVFLVRQSQTHPQAGTHPPHPVRSS